MGGYGYFFSCAFSFPLEVVGGDEAGFVFGNEFFQYLLYAFDVVGFDVMNKVVEFWLKH